MKNTIKIYEIEGRKTRCACFDCANKIPETAESPLYCLAEWGGMDNGQPTLPHHWYLTVGDCPQWGPVRGK